MSAVEVVLALACGVGLAVVVDLADRWIDKRRSGE